MGVQSSPHGLTLHTTSRIEMAEERIRDLENRSMEIILSEGQRVSTIEE